MTNLTVFQTEGRDRVTQLFADSDLEFQRVEESTAKMPHMAKEESAVRLCFDRGEVWLYEDEATFSWDDEDVRLEREDFESPGALLAALLESIQLRLRRL